MVTIQKSDMKCEENDSLDCQQDSMQPNIQHFVENTLKTDVKSRLASATVAAKPPKVTLRRKKSYLCEICGKSHRPIKEPMKCNECNLRFCSKSQQRKHQCNTYKNISFVCSRCRKSFTKKKNLKNHILNDICRKIALPCEVCGKMFATKGLLNRHKIVHTTEKPFTCDICGKSFAMKNRLKAHQVSHLSEKRFQCELCAKKFSLLGTLKRHHLQFHSSDQLPFPCVFCLKSYLHEHMLKSHMASHRNTFECMYCQEIFYNSKGLKAHYSKLHPGQKTVSCSACQRTFSRKDLMKIHKCEPNTDPSKCRYQCPDCGKKFLRKSFVVNHKCSIDKEDLCENASLSSGDGSVRDQLPFPCQLCSKSYLHEKELKSHLARHKNAFECTYCENVFYSKKDLNTHCSKEHPNQKFWCCSICERTFSRKDLMKVHKCVPKSDASSYRYQCPDCGKRFLRKSFVMNHKCNIGDVCADMSLSSGDGNGRLLNLCSRDSENKDVNKECDNFVDLKLTSTTESQEIGQHSPEPLMKQVVQIDEVSVVQPTEEHDNEAMEYIEAQVEINSDQSLDNNDVKDAILNDDVFLGHVGSEKDFNDDGINCFVGEVHFQKHVEAHDNCLPLMKSKISRRRRNDDSRKRQKRKSSLKIRKNGELPENYTHTQLTEANPDSLFLSSFRTKQKIGGDLEREKSEIIPLCEVCGKIHRKGLARVCKTCGLKFCYMWQKKQHVCNLLGASKRSCPTCGSVFAREFNRLRHIQLRVCGGRDIPCERCGKTFQRKDLLRKHMIVHSTEKPFTCEVCGKSFAMKNRLKAHIETHSTAKLFQCEICYKQFGLLGSLKRHLINVHRIDPLKGVALDPSGFYNCVACKKGFPRESDYKLHMYGHTRHLNTVCECSICGRIFKQPTHLRQHIAESHDKLKPFSCDICFGKFARKSTLKKHKCSVTLVNRPYPCLECGKSFARRYYVKFHKCLGSQKVSEYKCYLGAEDEKKK